MAPGFSFPPPPPPPPKHTAAGPVSGTDPYEQSQRGRGRGRGGNNGYQGQSYRHAGRGSRGGYGGDSTLKAGLPSGLPPGAFVNPAFTGQLHQADPATSQGNGYDDGNLHQKRKRVDDKSWTRDTRYAPHPMRKGPTMPRDPPVPSVPSFGGSITLPAKPTPAPKPSAGTNKLGLNPSLGDAVVASDESEDEDNEELDDEEAAYTALQTGPLIIEHEGSVIKLQDSGDIKQWIAQRKAMFPSRSRIEAKNVELQQRIEERKRIEREAELASAPAPAVQPPQPPVGPELHEDSDSDAAPEQTSSKDSSATAVPARAAPRVCAVFRATGACKFGHKCRYQHPAGIVPKPKPSGKMTLHQRLVEQELEKTDMLAVQAIKYLGDLGFFRREAT